MGRPSVSYLMSEKERQAMITTLRFLSATPKSRKALQKKLEAKGFEADLVKKVLGRLETQGLINDRGYALGVFQNLTLRRISGRKRIAFELEKKGVEESLIREVLDRYSPDEERGRALELARQKRERWKLLDRMKRRKKTFDFLLRRGFDYALSREVVAELERGQDPAD